jgi:hypothetical protein
LTFLRSAILKSTKNAAPDAMGSVCTVQAQKLKMYWLKRAPAFYFDSVLIYATRARKTCESQY